MQGRAKRKFFLNGLVKAFLNYHCSGNCCHCSFLFLGFSNHFAVLPFLRDSSKQKQIKHQTSVALQTFLLCFVTNSINMGLSGETSRWPRNLRLRSNATVRLTDSRDPVDAPWALKPNTLQWGVLGQNLM